MIEVDKCTFARRADGTPICGRHWVELKLRDVIPIDGPNPPGLGHLSAGICPQSGETVMETKGL